MLDTEQTGTRDNQVCQLSYIMIQPTGETSAENLYFAVDDMNEHAMAVHGLTITSLFRLSGGRKFKESAWKLISLLQSGRLAGHGIASDIQCLKNEFYRDGIAFKPVSQFCTMRHFAPIIRIPAPGQRRPKNPSLPELCEYLGVSKEAVLECENRYFNADGGQHDARYDTCATLLCIERGARRGIIRGILPEWW